MSGAKAGNVVVETFKVVEQGLWPFVQKVQEGVQAGYVVSAKNAYFPQVFGGLYEITLIKEVVIENEPAQDSVESPVTNENDVPAPTPSPESNEAPTASETQKKAGRPKK